MRHGDAPPPPFRRNGLVRMFIVITLSVLLAEVGVMLLLDAAKVSSEFTALLIDITVLAAFIIPLNYFLIYRRMIATMEDYHKKEEELCALTASLEQKVKERTALLASSEAEVHSVLESSADGILRIDTRGTILMANRAAHRLLGYKGMDLIGQHVSAIIPDDHMRLLVEGYLSFLGGWAGETVSDTVAAVGLKKGGERTDIELSISECIIGAKIQYVIIMRDISARKRTEETLRESRRMLTRTFASLDEGILVVEPKTRTIVSANPAMERIFGYGRDELLGKNTEFLYENRAKYEEFGQRQVEAFQSEGVFNAETLLRRKNGDLFPADICVTKILDESGNLANVVGVVRDISVRKKAEEALLNAKNAAEEATKLKDKFVALVSHDLKGPLGGVLGFIRLALARIKNPDEEARTALERAAESGHKMVALINDLLHLGRLRTGKIVPKARFIDAFAVAEKSMELLIPAAAAKGINMTNDIPEGTRVYADEVLLGEVLQNILSNAVKFCKEGDTVHAYMAGAKNPVIAISDTGAGIPPAVQERIFSYGEKTSTPGTANEMGSGLGLPLSNEIIHAHGGRISVQSEPGHGSVFFVELPVVRPKILVVDDTESHRILVRKYLEPVGAEISEARGGREALDILNNRGMDLIISNVWMPEMDGFELLVTLRQSPDLKKIPVIMLTGDSSMETRERTLKLGACDFVTKPIDPNELLPRIRRITG